MTGTSWEAPSVTAPTVACASTSVSAFFRYSTRMPFGSQRIDSGIEISVSVPAAISARLHIATACTVPMWFCTARRFFIDTRAKPGRNSSMRGEMEPKYGAFQQITFEKSVLPKGLPSNRCHAASARFTLPPKRLRPQMDT